MLRLMTGVAGLLPTDAARANQTAQSGTCLEEVQHLLSLPDDPAPLLERLAVKVGKTPSRYIGAAARPGTL